MSNPDLVIVMLREMRAEANEMRAETNGRFDAMEARFDAKFQAVDERFDAMEKRFDSRFDIVESTIADLAGQLVLLTRYVKNKTGKAIAELHERVTKLETKPGA